MRHCTLPLAMLIIAGCSQNEPAAEESAPSPAATQASAQTSAQATAVAAAPAQALLVPDRFHGIWDYAKGSCDPASDMRTEIASRGITFYESHGAVTALTVASPDRITVELAMQGEGEKWTDTTTFTLSENGTILTPRGQDDTGEPMPLKRCG